MTMLSHFEATLDRIQAVLNFRDWSIKHDQFSTNKSLGRAAFLGMIVGIVFGIHLTLFIVMLLSEITSSWTEEHANLAMQWMLYAMGMCYFHSAEFFVTAFSNPGVVTTDSFMINNSKAYTLAALMSWFEFWARFFFFSWFNSKIVTRIGLVMMITGQILRSLAMKTAGESFNHIIQNKQKDNHRLVTHGIYRYFRHPSYVGFFYWSIGTQLVLCNPINCVFYAWASWAFFKSRIPYEETTLKRQYKEYLDYMKTTWIGIPFISSNYTDKSEGT
mmetsp:Transcript_40075/g.48836  ORF Transcript_40075/g.48836 Transcript_40075/m.48836 type:complete len:274 (-) Transcript_40075:22-843(-)|eukprot:CAMPEP_0172498442 /NCGR_PEP_ID=MMETSP1066-20121228/113435_1 /TAXON_ID=671091 /ORGANISM="Coscinodiscus wailesii, Strain CCMP2513" /LENGTH=273 /DNA_ID=CAMNT_0013271719 /DNA_START=146 /DNA_END=967 /DNA_ORIENTATION=-